MTDPFSSDGAKAPPKPYTASEGRREIRSFVLRQGRFTPAQQRAFDDAWPRFGLDYAGVPRDLDATFGRTAPRVLEIGFGNGEALRFAARQDPSRDYMPSIGRLHRLRAPAEGKHVRVDTGVREGDTISVHYDPMIAKLIVWDETRRAATRRLSAALGEYEIARLPMRHEPPEYRDITADYSLEPGGTIRVANRARDGKGELHESIGEATVVEGSGNARLEVVSALHGTEQRIADLRDRVLVIGLAGVLVAVLAVWLIASVVLRPLRRLREVTASIADDVVKKLHEAGASRVRVEGQRQGDWVLIDANDLIVHVFRPEIRTFYNLEKMWSGRGGDARTSN